MDNNNTIIAENKDRLLWLVQEAAECLCDGGELVCLKCSTCVFKSKSYLRLRAEIEAAAERCMQ